MRLSFDENLVVVVYVVVEHSVEYTGMFQCETSPIISIDASHPDVVTEISSKYFIWWAAVESQICSNANSYWGKLICSKIAQTHQHQIEKRFNSNIKLIQFLNLNFGEMCDFMPHSVQIVIYKNNTVAVDFSSWERILSHGLVVYSLTFVMMVLCFAVRVSNVYNEGM